MSMMTSSAKYLRQLSAESLSKLMSEDTKLKDAARKELDRRAKKRSKRKAKGKEDGN